MSSKSNTYTAKDFFDHATRDIKDFPENDPVYAERFSLIDRASQITQAMVADIVSEAYVSDFLLNVPDQGKYLSSGGSYTLATRTLTGTMLPSDWSSDDIENIVVFREGTDIYFGVIDEYVDTTNVILRADSGSLPLANIATVEEILMPSSLLTYDGLDISTYRMLRYGAQIKIQILSTASTVIFPLTHEAFEKWRTSAAQNKNAIAWTLIGTSLYLKKGLLLSNFGTVTLRMPVLPLAIGADGDYMDLLDGAMIQIGIVVLRDIIEKRLGRVPTANKEGLAELIQSLYRSSSGEISKQEAMAKIEALL